MKENEKLKKGGTKEMRKQNLNRGSRTSHITPHTSQRGITLIALVITIIVMLILVTVSVSAAINGGLFGYAKNAVDETQAGVDAEQKLADGKVKVDGNWYASIEHYLAGIVLEEGVVLDQTALTLKIEEGYNAETGTPVTGQLAAELNEIEGTITWTSDNEAVATVSETGVVTAITEGTAKITATCIYNGETYTATCDVTVEIPKITASEVSNNLTTYLGAEVNYGATYTDASSYGNGKWEIFYADEEHIYIITKGHLAIGSLSTTGYNGTSDFTEENLQNKYPAVAQGLFNKTYNPELTPALQYAGVDSNGEPYTNMKATQYLLDSTVWSRYANSFAVWAIGGPTFELFVKSFNEYYPSNTVTLETPTGNGYANPLSTSGSVPSGTYLNHSTSTYYWLACPSSYYSSIVRDVNGGDAYVDGDSFSNNYAFRPVVCLKSNVNITWNSTTSQYDLELVSGN